MSAPSYTESLYQPSQDSRNILEEGVEKVQELRTGRAWLLCSPTQQQVSQHSSMDGEELWRPHPLLRSYWQFKTAGGGVSFFSSGMWPPVDCPRSGGWTHANAHTGSTNWTQWVFVVGWGGGFERTRREGDVLEGWEGEGRRWV